MRLFVRVDAAVTTVLLLSLLAAVVVAGELDAQYPGRLRTTDGEFLPDLDVPTIVVLGSSSAVGTGASTPDSSWVGRYRRHILALDASAQVINLAVGGYTTYSIMPDGYLPPNARPSPSYGHNITRALAYQPWAIIINLPSNDVGSGFTLEEQFANYAVVLQLAADAHVPVWISTTQPRGYFNEEQRALQRAVADTTLALYGEQALDFWYGIATDDGTLQPEFDSGDGVHLNDAGHAELYRRVVNSNLWSQITAAESDPQDRSPVLPNATLLHPNAPNPFNPSTSITFDLTRAGTVILAVYDPRGRQVRRLITAQLPAGRHDAVWDGRDDRGSRAASGVYICRLETPDRILSQPMLMVK